MNRRLAISVVATFVIVFALSFVVHGVLLYGDYARLPNVMRPEAEAQARLPLMALAYVFYAAAFGWIYQQGREDKPWLPQGLRYGLAMAALTVVPVYLIYHVVSPFPLDLAVKQIVLDSIVVTLTGIVVAWINR
jgi:hypothetical protein